MEILSFAFGMLSVIAVTLIAVVVVGMVKVIKMEKVLDQHKSMIEEFDNAMSRRIDHETSDISNTLSNDRKEIYDSISEVYRYADSRFDKLETKFIGNSAKKQLIKD